MVKKLTLADAQATAAAKGGKCLATKYTDAKTPIPWKCGKCSHVWSQRLAIVRFGSWCPKCAGNVPLTIEDAHAAARQKGGECLSTEYVNNHTHLLWKCGDCSFVWGADLNHVKDGGRWCPQCAGNLRLTLEEAQQIAEARGGKCLSTHYLGSNDPMDWECGDCKGQWTTTFHSIKHLRSWCPNCLHKGETETRKIFEDLTGYAFPHARGLFPENPRWDLDGYCDRWGVAFEFHGQQHYEYIPRFFHKYSGIEGFEKQKTRDEMIERLALDREDPIYLIVIPYWLTYDEKREIIRQELWYLGATNVET
jgi:Zn finger protein HypA/HybF involved in hydrogenase expression